MSQIQCVITTIYSGISLFIVLKEKISFCAYGSKPALTHFLQQLAKIHVALCDETITLFQVDSYYKYIDVY